MRITVLILRKHLSYNLRIFENLNRCHFRIINYVLRTLFFFFLVIDYTSNITRFQTFALTVSVIAVISIKNEFIIYVVQLRPWGLKSD